ncbi:MAG: glycosyltransferase family 4 protein [Bdellovibrionales bacterium]|nr:glycosyltransferase family 4 protein [Bdellovibrionales bacterium]
MSRFWGGVEQTAFNDLYDLASSGLDVKLLCLQGSPLHEEILKGGNDLEKVHVIPLESRPREVLDLQFRGLLHEQIINGVNIVHSHHTSLLGSISPWLWRHPRVVLLASRYLMAAEDKHDPIHRLIYGRVDSVLVTSESLRQNVIDTHPVKERRVRVVNPGLDFAGFDPALVNAQTRRQTWGADEKTVVIGTVGRIHPEKGQELLVKAAAGLLKDRFGSRGEMPQLKFIIVGEDAHHSGTPFRSELQELVRQFRIQEHVIFEDYGDHVAEMMQGFDIFVMPARRESLGLVVLEAMAMECPLVLSDTGSFREVVGNQDYGLTFRSDDAFNLQRQLRTLVADSELRAKMGRQARLHVVKNYHRSLRLQRTLEIYDRCLKVRQAF